MERRTLGWGLATLALCLCSAPAASAHHSPTPKTVSEHVLRGERALQALVASRASASASDRSLLEQNRLHTRAAFDEAGRIAEIARDPKAGAAAMRSFARVAILENDNARGYGRVLASGRPAQRKRLLSVLQAAVRRRDGLLSGLGAPIARLPHVERGAALRLLVRAFGRTASPLAPLAGVLRDSSLSSADARRVKAVQASLMSSAEAAIDVLQSLRAGFPDGEPLDFHAALDQLISDLGLGLEATLD